MSAKVERQSLQQASSTNMVLYGMIAIGILTFAIGLFTNVERTWRAFLLNDLIFLGLGIGALAFLAFHNLASSGSPY